LTRSRRLAAALGLAATLTFAPTSAQATVVVPLSRQEMVDRSDLVVRATVLAQQSFWNGDHSQILTHTRLRVDAWLKGSGSQELVLEQLGGSVDGLESRVAGDGWLSVGQQAVLFLRAQNGLVYLTSLAQSVYFIDAAPSGRLTVRRDLTQLSFARPVNGQYQIASAPLELAETLEHLTADVTRLARGAR
jgi:hypothetical protein